MNSTKHTAGRESGQTSILRSTVIPAATTFFSGSENMVISAKYAGKCSQCGGAIDIGDSIEWTRGSGAKHETCPAPVATIDLRSTKSRPATTFFSGSEKMVISAKYAGKCRQCGGAINIGDSIEWTRGGGAKHETCPEQAVTIPDDAIDAPYYLGGGSGYGCNGWTEGETLRTPDRESYAAYPRYLTVVTTAKTYFACEGLSFGVGDEAGHTYSAQCRAATDDEAAPLIARDETEKKQRRAGCALRQIATEIDAAGDYPEGTHDLDGQVVPIGEGQTIYGGGEWFVVCEDYIWHVRNNGGDGDNWAHNNVRTGGAGAIGKRVPATDELADRINSNFDAAK